MHTSAGAAQTGSLLATRQALPHLLDDMQATAAAPIGVFDSGIGGLSVLLALQAELPAERFVYLADGAGAPYGGRSSGFVHDRSQAITEYLRQEHAIKALVVACNTATSAAIDALRDAHPDLPIIGVEPALKPAARVTRTRRIAVMATRSTTASPRFARLLAALPDDIECIVQPCDGLADAIEHAAAAGLAAVFADAAVTALCARYVRGLGPLGRTAGAVDTIVLGCTHYVFAQAAIAAVAGAGVRLLDTGDPVARQARRLLGRLDLLRPTRGAPPPLLLTATSNLAQLRAIARDWPDRPALTARAVLPPATMQSGAGARARAGAVHD